MNCLIFITLFSYFNTAAKRKERKRNINSMCDNPHQRSKIVIALKFYKCATVYKTKDTIIEISEI